LAQIVHAEHLVANIQAGLIDATLNVLVPEAAGTAAYRNFCR
jgi:hypothetical protein